MNLDQRVSICRVFHGSSLTPRYRAFMPFAGEVPEEADAVALARAVKKILLERKLSPIFDWEPPCAGEWYHYVPDKSVWYEPLRTVERQQFRFELIES